ncbi:MAG: MMPL family transporter [Lachnospiraceae bacterium]|nr:MMPL family transporter [Lachnospiraceae bacterium]
MKLAKGIVKQRFLILIIAIALLIPSLIGMLKTRINYDMLTYLPEDMDTVIGQNVLMDEFGKGAFSFIVVEGMDTKDTAALAAKLREVEHVDTVLWYDSFVNVEIPMEILPDKVYDMFNNGDCTMMAVFFDSSTSSDVTMDAIKEIRRITGKQCYVSGMSALVTDLKALCEQEEPIYVGIAVLLATVAMLIFLDGWLVPFVFLASIGMAILYNLGSNIFMGEISYITKALSAVLQLAVTMDYSIFLWNCYNEKMQTCDDHKEAMAMAIKETFTSVLGSSITTVAGFIALCFMSFTLGADLGIVMAKGVLLGVIACVTILPSLILILDKPLHKTMHKAILPKMDGLAGKLLKIFPVFIVLFVLIAVPAYSGYSKTNKEVYYDMSACLPENIEVIKANEKLSETFNVASTHMLLVDKNLPDKEVRAMLKEMEDVEGVEQVLGLETVLGAGVPEEIIPEKLKDMLESDNWRLVLINSQYHVASDAVNEQIDKILQISKKYDSKGMLIGEGPCMKDMIETTDHDFKVVNTVSIVAIFVIIALVEKSISLPFILIAVIELAIFINLGLPHYLGQSLPFIAPICISTIQLGATVDYAILMTTRYKKERNDGKDKHEAVKIALASSIPSIIVSGMGLFSATFGVAVYSNIDIISSMCMLMARGAVISMVLVILALPAMLMLFDGLIIHTTMHMRDNDKNTATIGKERMA